uniref:Uncharacterized protein n=1 Tax=Lotharella oceanica TaxID=641309 RepID=A0A7S2X7Y0_9EUKA
MGLMEDDRACKMFKCPQGSTAVRKPKAQFRSAGCDAISRKVSLPPSSDHTELTECCDVRMACQSICGIRSRVCDNRFKKCAENTCRRITDKEKRKSCEHTQQLLSMAVGLAECGPYNKAQKKACKCVQDNEAPAHRKAQLASFYKTYNKAMMKTVDRKVKQATSSLKWANVVYNAMKKHPQCIIRNNAAADSAPAKPLLRDDL